MKNCFLHLIALLLFSHYSSIVYGQTKLNKSVLPPAPLPPIPSEKQIAWHDMEMNAFIHFTTNTFTGLEWGYGNENPSIFNPTALDALQWVRTLKKAGFKGVILTTKHHDGFCLWPSKFTEHSVKNSPWKKGRGDVVKEVAEACKQEGLKFGVYLSPWDRNRADYGSPSYIQYYRNQLTELFTQYGPVFEMWFDGANGGNGYYGGANETRKINGATYYDWPNTLNIVRSLQPQVLFFSDAGPDIRWCGNERGIAGETNWNTISNDTLYAGKPGIEKLLNTGSEDGKKWIPAEVDVSIRKGWFYHAQEDSLVKTPERLFDIYLTSVGRGSILLLNVPPDQRGLIHQNDVKALEGFRQLLDQEFKVNLTKGAKITADTYRGKNAAYAASQMIDANKETYWATDDAIKTGAIEIDFGKSKTIKYVVLQEYIQLGQRVKSFTIDVWQNNEWKQVASTTTIGYKRIVKLEPVLTNKVRIQINEAKASPVLSNLEIY
ncbi:MAG: alpha-L-fucosidase [Flavisolibacter sp.]|nr:alpha-L-fucosidase [Flavisolibacter sp.]